MNHINKLSFLLFLIVGGSATLFHYLIMAICISVLGISSSSASAIGYTFSALYNYWANARFTFGGGYRHAKSLPRFAATALMGLGINQLILFGTLSFSLPLFIAQPVATLCVLLWNYFINAIWTFSKRDYS